MKALILAAGYATRLYPLTKEYPKSLLEINNRPIINYIIDKITQIKDIDEIIVVTNSKFIGHFDSWHKNLRLDLKITLVDDLTKDNADRRGAIGDVYFAVEEKNIQDGLLVVGGDNLFDAGLADFIKFAKDKCCPAIGVYDIKDKLNASKYGIASIDAESRVVDFEEKPLEPKSTLAAMCLYYFPKNQLGLIKEYMQDATQKHDATGFYIDWLRKKTTVYGFVFSGNWYDIGDHKFYNKAKKFFAK